MILKMLWLISQHIPQDQIQKFFKVGEGRRVSLPLIVFAKVGRTQELGIQNGGINILLGLAPPSPTFKVWIYLIRKFEIKYLQLYTCM